MDFGTIFQIKAKRAWLVDVVFYFVMSALIATVACYIIFLVKNASQEKEIQQEISALQTVGTDQQKQQEAQVIAYQKKINDFVALFKNHQFASQVFYFMQQETMPNVWFGNFSMDEKTVAINLSGQAADADTFSRQVAAFENSEYVKSVGVLNSKMGEDSKVQFNLSLVLNPKILNYIAAMNPVVQVQEQVAPATSSAQPKPSENPATALPKEEPVASPSQPKTALVLILTALLLVIVAGAGFAVWFYFKKRKSKIANNQQPQI